MEKLIYLVRHGQTEFNAAQRLQGQCDSTLTDLGIAQARRMGGHLKPLIGDHKRWEMIASPLGRTVRTAEIIRDTIGLDTKIRLDPRIQEIHVGDWEGFTHAELEAAQTGVTKQPGWLLRTPGGERYEDIAKRIGAFISDIDEDDGIRRIVVSHGIAGRIMRGLYTGAAPPQFWGPPAPPQDAVFHLSRGKVARIDEQEAA